MSAFSPKEAQKLETRSKLTFIPNRGLLPSFKCEPIRCVNRSFLATDLYLLFLSDSLLIKN